jgi:hypothetical protein
MKRIDPWLAFLTAALVAFAAAILLSGCDWCRGSVPAAPTPTPSPLRDLAGTLTWGGGIIASLAVVLRVVAALGLVAGPIGGILAIAAPILSLAGWAGVAGLGAGLALTWIADHPAVVVLAIVAAALARWAWRSPGLRRRVARLAQPKPKPQ